MADADGAAARSLWSLLMADTETYNEKVIREFRAARDAGQVSPARLLIHHTGRKTGTERVNPVAYLDADGSWAIFATKGGGPKHPEWYLNLVANPRTTAEIGLGTVEVVARTAEGAERERLWEAQKQAQPRFAEYEVKATTRQIPVVILDPVA
jgi:deazaflavin-dependent oxidoreductase (nitroreductase family)